MSNKEVFERTSKEDKAEVRLIVHYNRDAHNSDSIRKYLENLSSPLVTIIVTKIRRYS